MDHQIVAGVGMLAIVLVRKADVDSAIKTAVGLKLVEPDAVKAFRAFKIPFAALRAEAAGEVTDAVGIEQAKFVADFAIELQRAFFLKNLQIDRGTE